MEENEKNKEKKGFSFNNLYNLDKYKVALVALVIFTILVRFYFFFKYAQQPVFWDESEHLVMAKHIAFDTPLTGWNASREIVLPLIYAFFFKLFNSEIVVRFVQLFFSIAAVLLTYFVGKEIFNKTVGLVAALGMSIFSEFLFWSLRFGLEPIGLTFSLLMILFFWKGYVKKQRQKLFLPLAAAFGALAVMSNAKEGVIIGALFLFLLFTDKFQFLKNKYIWISIVIALLVALPFMVYHYKTVGHPLPRLQTQSEAVSEQRAEGGWSWKNFFGYMAHFDNYLGLSFLIIFLAGLIYMFITLIIGFDLIIKGHDEILRYVAVLLLAAAPLLLHSYFFGISPGAYLDPRIVLESFPAVFLIAGFGFTKIYDWLSKYKKELAYVIVAFLLIYAVFTQIKVASSTIESKSQSYQQVKESALWIKENSNSSDIVFAASAPQMTYYAERRIEGYPEKQVDYEQKIIQLKPKYMVVSVFEQHPEYVYKWAEREQKAVKVARAYITEENGQQQPLLIVYEFISYEF